MNALSAPPPGTAVIMGTASAVYPFTYQSPSENYMLSLAGAGGAMTMASIAAYNMGSDGTGPFSVGIWVQGQAADTGSLVSRIGPVGGNGPRAGFSFSVLSNSRLAYEITNGRGVSVTQTSLDGTSVNDGNWHFVTLVRNSPGISGNATLDIYFDSVQQPTFGSAHRAINITTDAVLSIGSVASDAYTGNVAEARFWARALSADEIMAQMTAPPADRSDLVGEWLFANGSTMDTSPIGNNGNLQGPAQIVPGGPST